MMMRICHSSIAASAAFRTTTPTRRSSVALFSSRGIIQREQQIQSSHHDQPRIVIVGGGITGIATAYYLIRNHGLSNLTILEQGRQPMSFTSAQSGENYRNWWPHVTMIKFTNRSIKLMEEFASNSELGKNRIDMTRRGYVLATRQKDSMDKIVEQLLHVQKQQQNGSSLGLYNDADIEIRFHEDTASMIKYQSSSTFGIENWNLAPTGMDVVTSKDMIRKEFPSLDPSMEGIVHIRRAGDISGYSLGSIMLQYIRGSGGKLQLDTTVNHISYNPQNQTFNLDVTSPHGRTDDNVVIVADYLVNAAGPLANSVLEKLMGSKDGHDDKDNAGFHPLPIKNVYQQKLAFEDHVGAIPRDLPFCIDLDSQYIDWKDEERDSLSEDNSLQYLLEEFPGSIHCRPDGHSQTGKWIKLGWAFNETPSDPTQYDLLIDKNDSVKALADNERNNARNLPSQATLMNDWFPEIVLRGAARLHPTLRAYYDGKLPHHRHHYGGWYSMTEENWPLIGPLISIPNKSLPSPASPPSQPQPPSSRGTTRRNDLQLFDGRVFLNCAPSGFGTMTACAGGELCAAWIASHPNNNSLTDGPPTILPDYAESLSLHRYHNHELMTSLRESEKGLL